jgi:predicted nucleic acid-binding protein
MGAEVFFDTNVLLYALVPDPKLKRDARTEMSEDLLANGGVVSVQVLNEFSDVASRKLGKSWSEIAELLEGIEVLCGTAVPLTAQVQKAAVRISGRHRFRIYDSLILAAAIESKCDVLFSEDLQDGQVIEGLRIENPFKAL